MGQLLLVVFVVAVAMLASLKAAAVILGGLLLSTLVVQATATRIGRTPITLGEALRALVLSTFFSIVAAITVWSFLSGGGFGAIAGLGPTAAGITLTSAAGLLILAFQYGAYFLGFRVALGLPFLHSALVAVVSTAILGACWWAGMRLLA